jgi:hypothetical protein
MEFIEMDGMILLRHLDNNGNPVGAGQAMKREPDFPRWRYERRANHMDTRSSALDRRHVSDELELAADLKDNLRAAYPDRSFVVTHIPCYGVSFYQLAPEAPIIGTRPTGEQRGRDVVLCIPCQVHRKMRHAPPSDLDLPMTDWYQCEICGAEFLTYCEEILTPIGPSH